MQRTTFSLSTFKPRHVLALCCGVLCLAGMDANAAVVQRGTTSAARPTVSRPNTTSRLPTTVTNPVAQPVQTVVEETVVTEEPPVEEAIIIENKSSQFDSILGATSASSSDLAADERAALIRAQRAALDAAGNTETTTLRIQTALNTGVNPCDTSLRDCMKTKCGNDFSKCAGDGDTTWGDKLNSCRRDTTCSAEEFKIFAVEIKADRDHKSKMASYQDVLDCGNNYNNCIFTQCGTDLSKCVGKQTSDAATAKCASIARDCQAIDSGLTARAGQVFGTLRDNAQIQVRQDEEKLYALRDQMRSVCSRMGAMFDERSLDCVYTVNLFANNSATPFASKKAYAGNSFDCTQNWFGIDITTYRENAYRLTREQTSATNAFMGAGVGTAAGAISSGAINRAIDTHKAERAAKKAEDQHEEDFGDSDQSQQDNQSDHSNQNNEGDGEANQENSDDKASKKEEKEEKKAERQAEKEVKQAEKEQKKAERQANREAKKADKANK